MCIMSRRILIFSKKAKRPNALKKLLEERKYIVEIYKDYKEIKNKLSNNKVDISVFFISGKKTPDVLTNGFEEKTYTGNVSTICICESKLKKYTLSDNVFYMHKSIDDYIIVQFIEDLFLPKLIEKNYPVLLVCDDVNEKNILSVTLDGLGCEITLAQDTGEAFELIKENNYSLILINPYSISKENVLEIISCIKNRKAFTNTPVIVFSTYLEQEEAYNVLNAGADDVIRKPYYPEELCTRLSSHLKLSNVIKEMEDIISTEEQLNMKLLELNDQLTQTNDLNKRLAKALEEQANTDELTGVFNRRQTIQVIERGMNHAYDYKKELSCIIIDIDHFKRINDSYGHDFGDKVIRETALLVNVLLETDCTIGRWGGEEFVVVLLGYSKEKTLKIAEKIREKIKSHVYTSKSKEISASVSVSQGVSILKTNEKEKNVDSLVNRADKGLYIAKEQGRDCVIFVD